MQVPESRWLGLKKTEARVRARVRPTQPRAKRENRPRRGRKGDETKGRSTSSKSRDEPTASAADHAEVASAAATGTKSRGARSTSAKGGGGDGSGSGSRGADDSETRSPAGEATGAEPKSEAGREDRDRRPKSKKKEKAVSEATQQELVPIDEQTEMVESFLRGVLTGFGLAGQVTTEVVDGDVQADVTGSNLGLLIGPKGGTIRALQEVTRAAAQRHADGRETHRINVDVAGYRERRRDALGEFARRQAEVVRQEGRRVALEPMGSADRKAVHDAVLDIEGVRSISEGDDPRRRVVLIPDD